MMSTSPPAGFVPPTDFVPPTLALLLKTARAEIDRHVNDQGLCVVCRCVFPCERAVLADLALSAL
jgi:hypothetical protein